MKYIMFQKTSIYPIYFTLPVVWYMSYIWIQHILDRAYWSFLDSVNFFIHEFGHLFFALFWNELISVLWGTLMQLIIPLLLIVMFLFQWDRFAISFCCGWIGINMFYVSMYSGDAQDQLLPLIWTWGWHIIHDWNYIFSHFWVLHKTDFISDLFFMIGNIFFVFFIVYSSILIINRLRNI